MKAKILPNVARFIFCFEKINVVQLQCYITCSHRSPTTALLCDHFYDGTLPVCELYKSNSGLFANSSRTARELNQYCRDLHLILIGKEYCNYSSIRTKPV